MFRVLAILLASVIASCGPIGNPPDKKKLANDLKVSSPDDSCTRVKTCIDYPSFPVGRICGCCHNCKYVLDRCMYETCLHYCEDCYHGKCQGC